MDGDGAEAHAAVVELEHGELFLREFGGGEVEDARVYGHSQKGMSSSSSCWTAGSWTSTGWDEVSSSTSSFATLVPL